MMRQPDARYIYQDGQFGVIGVPQNSPFGLKNYDKQAKELMARHFPEGFEIVRAEEVVEGQRVLDMSRSRQIETEPTINALDQKIKLGRVAESTSTQQKDSIAITESRIIYRRRLPQETISISGFSEKPSLAPELYLDPNELMRTRARVEIAEAKQGQKSSTTLASKTPDPTIPAKTTDPATKTADATSKTVDPSTQKASLNVNK